MVDTALESKFPKELEGIVKKEDIEFLGHGKIIEYSDKKDIFGLYREINIMQSVQVLEVDEKFLKSKSLKSGDGITYVQYPIPCGRYVLDIFQN
jgi:hypothetical protein